MEKQRMYPDRSIRIAVFTMAMAICFSAASAQDLWSNLGTGNWFTAGNWSAGVPNSGTIAQVDNGGTARINSAAPPTGAALSLSLGTGSGQSGNLLVNNTLAGGLNVTLSLVVGAAGTGTMTLHNVGAVSDGSASV